MKTLAIAAFLLASACQAQGVGRLAQVQIVDRDTGAALTLHRHRGEWWVAGKPGGRYAIRVSNPRAGRMLAVMSVDGINVITGQHAGWNQSGYVFAPGDGYEVAGWRKSDAEIAAFEFTDPSRSYAALTGRPGNIGVIGLALFRERPRHAVEAMQRKMTGEPSPDNAAASGSTDAGQARAESGPARPSLGTGHGEREYSPADTTRFDRLGNTPDEIIRIRYDSYDNLVAMGVIPGQRRVPPVPDAFPQAPAGTYVPDPPAGG